MRGIIIKNQTGRIREIAEAMNSLVEEFYQVRSDYFNRYQLLVEVMNKECPHPRAVSGGGYTCVECGITDNSYLEGDGGFKNFQNTLFQLDVDDREHPDDVAFQTKDGKPIKIKGPLPYRGGEGW